MTNLMYMDSTRVCPSSRPNLLMQSKAFFETPTSIHMELYMFGHSLQSTKMITPVAKPLLLSINSYITPHALGVVSYPSSSSTGMSSNTLTLFTSPPTM